MDASFEPVRQYLLGLATDGELSLDAALNATIGDKKIGDIPGVRDELTKLAVDGKLSVDELMEYISSRYTYGDGGLLPKPGAGNSPGDAAGIDYAGLSELAALMMLMIQNAAEQRKTGQEIRAAQSEQVQTELLDAADKMRDGAITAMALGFAAGVASIAGGVAGAFAAGGGSADLASSRNAIGGGASSLLKSVGDGVQGILNADAKLSEAEAEKIRNEREAEGDTIANLKDFMQTTMQLIQTMLEKENETLGRVLA
jgi:hypothetical protein